MLRKLSSGKVSLFVIVIILLALVVVGGAIYFVIFKSRVVEKAIDTGDGDIPLEVQEFTFENPKKSAHYESNTPEHGVAFPAVPTNVVINFNFDLSDASTISIKNGETEYGLGNSLVDTNKLTLRRQIDPAAPDGLYMVTYNACWPDETCHDGYFQFAIDRSLSNDFIDMLDKSEIEVRLSQLAFNPRDIVIKQGTKVTWINDEDPTHYINTDSHPAHTYELNMNSRALTRGGSYSYTFEKEGIFPYHCSAHAADMKGNIIVRAATVAS